MQYFLAKTDPETYSIQNLAQDKETIWDTNDDRDISYDIC